MHEKSEAQRSVLDVKLKNNTVLGEEWYLSWALHIGLYFVKLGMRRVGKIVQRKRRASLKFERNRT